MIPLQAAKPAVHSIMMNVRIDTQRHEDIAI
jgi:hypothetical protein